VGAPIRKNSGDSYRFGLELDATIAITDKLLIRPNMTISTNKNKDFLYKRWRFNRFGNTNIAYSPDIIVEMSLLFTGTQFSNIVFV
jgi:iron complex outermembrane receptor protein